MLLFGQGGGFRRSSPPSPPDDEDQVTRNRRYLEWLAATAWGNRENNDYCSQEDWQLFSLQSPSGKQVYDSYSDEDLLNILREAAQKLGYSPAQKDIYCILRSYIKHRFQKWPYALHKAGLRGLAGKGGRMEEPEGGAIEPEYRALLHQVAAKAEDLGYPPTKGDLPEIAGALKQRFGSWPAVLRVAELAEEYEKQLPIATITDLEPEYQELLLLVRAKARELGRTPLKPEVEDNVRCRLWQRCGSWPSVLHQAGLEPLTGSALEQARKDYQKHKHLDDTILYRVDDLDPEYLQMLSLVERRAKILGRSPLKEEVDRDVSRKLRQKCGSWRNVLYQLGLEIHTRQQAAAIRRQLRERKK